MRTHEPCVPTFEVIEIELLDNLSNNSIFGNQRTNFTYSKGFSIGTANILKDVEKSYDKGKFLTGSGTESITFLLLPQRHCSVIFLHLVFGLR